VCTPAGSPLTRALADPKLDDRRVLTAILDHEPAPTTDRPGLTIIADKGHVSAELDGYLSQRGVALLRPSSRNRTPRPGEQPLKPIRRLIESVNDTLEGQLDLEPHGGRSIDGVGARIAQRLLAMTAAIWHNRATGPTHHPIPDRLRPLIIRTYSSRECLTDLAARVGDDRPVADRQVLSDEAWAWLEPLLPDRTPRRGGRWRDHRQVIEAVAWKYRTGVAWREIPTEGFGPWQTVYERLTRWSADGTWARLLAAAQADARGELDWLVAADSTLVRVHQRGAAARRFGGNAATAPGPVPDPDGHPGGAGSNYKNLPADRPRHRSKPAVAEPVDHAIGRSRGGLTTKIHLLADGGGRPLVPLLTAGNVNDTLMFAPLLEALRVARPGAPAQPPGLRAGRHGLQLPGQPRVAAPSRGRPHHPGAP
jgi:transposase